jgi:flagellar motor switch protein FliG
LKPLEKAAIFLVIVGLERGRNIIELMDNGEIHAIVPEIRKLTELSAQVQETVWTEFEQLGYDDKMKPSEVLYLIRLLFNGSKISNTIKIKS